ncbi:MAG: HAMP domain-containing sensor histidine kinase, partial [Acidobacteriota bacterium]
QWTDEQVGVLRDLGAMVMTEIELRTTVSDLDVAVAAAVAARKEAERANQAKSEFVAMMSHDLRTPLNAIGGYRQLLELGVHGPVNEDQLQALSRIKHAQDHLSYLISEVMDFARLESGSVSLDLSEVSVESVLNGLAELICPQLDVKQLTYIFSGGGRDTRMLADTEKVVRILTNLLTNAIKFTESGGTTTVAWVPSDEFVRITVTDSGIGIPADKIESVFEPFVQVPGQKKMNPQGVGLGLAIGRQLARLMGGELTASAAPVKGTTFSMTLPRAASSERKQ